MLWDGRLEIKQNWGWIAYTESLYTLTLVHLESTNLHSTNSTPQSRPTIPYSYNSLLSNHTLEHPQQPAKEGN